MLGSSGLKFTPRSLVTFSNCMRVYSLTVTKLHPLQRQFHSCWLTAALPTVQRVVDQSSSDSLIRIRLLLQSFTTSSRRNKTERFFFFFNSCWSIKLNLCCRHLGRCWQALWAWPGSLEYGSSEQAGGEGRFIEKSGAVLQGPVCSQGLRHPPATVEKRKGMCSPVTDLN